jgi:uncharacterized membrane protein YeaQ/YmgE (transglycosylase-associated protein family)
MYIILFLLFGLVVGALARLIVPGKEPGGWVVSMLLGVGGSLLGGLAARVLGLHQPGGLTGFVMALLGAIVLVALYHGATSSRHRTA